jgi:hypothetical protein
VELNLLLAPLLQAPLDLYHRGQTLAYRLTPTARERLGGYAEWQIGVAGVALAHLEEGEAVVERKPLVEGAARHVAGVVGGGLEGAVVGEDCSGS